MRPDRKAARDFVKNIKTKADLEAYLDMLNITEEEKEIALMIFANGYSRTQIAMETGYSIPQVKRKIAKIYAKLV